MPAEQIVGGGLTGVPWAVGVKDIDPCFTNCSTGSSEQIKWIFNQSIKNISICINVMYLKIQL